MNRTLPVCLVLMAGRLFAADHYIDPAVAGGTGTGNSWANAKSTLVFNAFTPALAAGDTVYISGGSSGNTQAYNMAGELTSVAGFLSGTAGNPVTYKIGQDSSHNGTAIFNRTSGGTQWLFGGNNYIVSGDAGDGNRHFKVTGYTAGATLNSVSNIRVSYVSFDTVTDAMVNINAGTGMEIDHCYGYITGLTANIALTALNLTGSTYTSNLFHHNEIHVPYDTALDGFGTDAMVTNSYNSVYNNLIFGYPLANARGNHQDGWQGAGGEYIAIYNNRFVDLQNYAVFAEGYTVSAAYTHVKIYNNIVLNTTGTGSQAFALSGSPTYPATDYVVANNLADGFSDPFTFRYSGTPGNNPTAFVDCYFYNNTSVNSGPNIIDLAITAADNVSVTSGSAVTYFSAWVDDDADNDYHLATAATPLIATGTDVSGFGITTDKDGVAYANPPSIGAYEYASGGGDTTDPTVTITSPNSSGSNTQTSAAVTISGTASDNVAVSSVAVVMTGATTGSVTITGTTSWSGSTTLNTGATTFTATATDSSANTGTDTHVTTYTVITPARPRRGSAPASVAPGF